jgi:hypothetical protein
MWSASEFVSPDFAAKNTQKFVSPRLHHPGTPSTESKTSPVTENKKQNKKA